ncbi:DNA-directed RNA polymerase subunit beta' [Blattabacterium cuenoti]|uniref:DNA-directed RNA polymerase subunit beta' n=1 Tax=Blattabacterium cuenoti TaxID=1653831 RepID=UPI00163C5DE8|nr:DNA-directed RNA polymerase subunit beta' [Blattabacterium cuenoti]
MNKNKKFSKITIRLASPEVILKESNGEVLKPETINYRTHKPERDGLFCERIFGPVKDYECACGKYKRIRYKGIVCDRCGVEVTEKKVRRERMGHISLIVPVVHIWCFRSSPNKIGSLLGLSSKKLEMIIYYERYVVVQGGIAVRTDGNFYKKGDFLSEEEYLSVLDKLPKSNQDLDDVDPNKFIAKMGAECVKDLLNRIDLDLLSEELRNQSFNETSKQRRIDALKRLQVVESFKEGKKKGSHPSWMIINVLSVIPPELRPLVPLDGGRYAASDMTDLYRRVLIRNNRLKRLIEIKAPEVILRNEKRMLQEAVDSLFDNSRKISAVKSEGNRPLKSLSDSLKGKQGRFRQNLLGKRVDYSARSVIVVGPHLKLHECGLPKDMAAELYKPFIIRKLIERGIVKTVKSAKKIIDNRKEVIWDILENVLKGHPILLNRAPTLHRLGIQAFQPKLIEGKAIQLHPLVCSAFNADFDGDQMAVHLPLSNVAILESKLLMLASQNILNPANGSPITVPSQDMVLGLYYMTKPLLSDSNNKIRGEGSIFYSSEEVEIAYNQKSIDLHALIKVKVNIREDNKLISKLVETTVGRVLFNQVVPKKVGYINESLTKKSLREIIGRILYITNIPTTSKFLDDIKKLGFYNAFKGGLSFGLGDIIIPDNKKNMVKLAIQKVDNVKSNYNMGLITNNERYNQIIDIWTNTNSLLTEKVMKYMREDRQGFNPIYMMLDSGARGSKEQIRQLSGMRGLMAKPQKTGAFGGEIIENPILSNFREGLSILEYFISTHGARKGLADTALKTADAGYLTRRLVDAAQDVIIKIEDCNTLRGLEISALKKNEEIVETLFDRILGRTSLNDIFSIEKNEILIVKSGGIIDENIAKNIEKSGHLSIEVRSPLTCEAKMGICAKCYGRNLSTGKIVQKGEAVGVIAAQSIGEPGTQLTLRTFHVGGTAGNITESSQIISKYDGFIELEDLKTVKVNKNSKEIDIVVSRTTEMKLLNNDKSSILMINNIPYGAYLYVKNGDFVKNGDIICKWDLYNAVIIAEFSGKISYQHLEQGVTFQVEVDEQTGFQEKVITEVRNKNLIPTLKIIDIHNNNDELKIYNLPVGAHLMVADGEKIEIGKILVKVPRKSAKSGDITGGLPRLSELFEARNPSNPAVVSEIDGIVSHGKIKRGNREIIVESKNGDIKKYLVKLTNQILVQENDYVKAGVPLSDGAITPNDILNIRGPRAVQEYLIKEIQEVYRLQGVKINDKHFEVIVLQMMRKVEVIESGDSKFLEGNIEYKDDFIEENDRISQLKIIENSGESEIFKQGTMVSYRDFRNENAILKYNNKKIMKIRNVIPATARPILQGITRSALQTKSFISAASFQETTKVLSEAAISSKTDYLHGLKENVIVGHKIPAGTGLKEYENIHIDIP